MSDGTKIEWTDATLNVVNGCSIVSPGCTNCYAMRSGGRNLPNHPATGLTKPTKAGHVWTGEVRFNEKALLQPLRWKRPRKIFWNAHGDLFHENVPDEWIDRCFAVMALTPQHVHQVLTKRPERMREYVCAQAQGLRHVTDHVDIWQANGLIPKHIDTFRGWIGQPGNPRPLPNVWLGVSVEDQQRADERIPVLLDTPAAVRWLSCEPLLGPVDLTEICLVPKQPGSIRAGIHADVLAGRYCESGMPYVGQWDIGGPCPPASERRTIDWVVAGGESGPGARPMHRDWARSLRDQCAAAGVPFLFKQWGEYRPVEWHERRAPGDVDLENDPYLLRKVGKKRAGRLLDGVQHDGYPA